MSFSCSEHAADRIEVTGYYRLKAYWLPFIEGATTTGNFRAGTSFDSVLELYCFDEKLRILVFSWIQKIEVGVRARLDRLMCDEERNPFWYLDSSIFGHGNGGYTDTVSKVRGHFLSSKETFAQHYKAKYHNEFCKFLSDAPPSWAALEIMTMGNLASTLNSISDAYIEEKKLNRFSNKKLGVDKFGKLCRWFEVFREVRNHCGHHSRLFNRNLRAPEAIKRLLDRDVALPKVQSGTEDQINRLYTALAAMQQILKKLGHGPIGPELRTLFDEHPITDQLLPSMGFPRNWHDETHFF